MAQLETVKIVSDKSKNGFVIINAQDFNPKTDVVYDESAKSAKAVEADDEVEAPAAKARKSKQ